MSKFSTPFSLSASAIATALLISACGGGSAPADTTPPTVAITDNVSAATATGPVTFTFTFSEDVGTSFVVEDISVAGGTAGTLTKTDATHYSLLVTPTANTTGTINVGVTAAKFKDIALNDNTAAASATQDFNTVAAASTVIATFDEATPLTFVGFDGAEGSSIAVGPSGGSGNAFKV
uniref:Ig-like domain-containing protein n=1 Tax=Undibacterium sp. TaxID=1914977 RepID=UPI003750DDD1